MAGGAAQIERVRVIGLASRWLDASSINDADASVRLGALATGFVRPAAAAPLRDVIAARLADRGESPEIRRQAALTLGMLRPLPVAALVAGLARWQGPTVRAAAATALHSTEGTAADAGETLARCLLAGDATVRLQSVLALRGIGAAAVGHVVKVVEEAEKFDITRMSGLDALGFIGVDGHGSLDLATRLSEDAPGTVRVCARFAVASIEGAAIEPDAKGRDKRLAKAAEPLAAMLEHEDEAVRLLAMERLGWLKDGAPSAGGALLRLLKEGSPAEREAAALGLARTRTPTEQAVEPLRGALQDEEPAVRKAAAIALTAYGTDAKPALGDLLRLGKDATQPEGVRRAAGECAKSIVKAERGPYWA
ncbi:MAG: HEAT repeat domain-containing protein [Phycisphaerales bacterium]